MWYDWIILYIKVWRIFWYVRCKEFVCFCFLKEVICVYNVLILLVSLIWVINESYFFWSLWNLYIYIILERWESVWISIFWFYLFGRRYIFFVNMGGGLFFEIYIIVWNLFLFEILEMIFMDYYCDVYLKYFFLVIVVVDCLVIDIYIRF